MRHTYELTTETIKVLTGNVQSVAQEYGCTDKHLYAILAGTQTDPFAVMEWLYAAAVKAGCDVQPWDDKLRAIRRRYLFPDESLSAAVETAGLAKEVGEVVAMELSGATVPQKLKEIDEAMNALHKVRKAVLDEYNAQADVARTPRGFAREAVSKRRAA